METLRQRIVGLR